MKIFLLMLITVVIDGIVSNIVPFQINQLSLLTPQFTIIGVFLIYPYFKKNNKYYYLLIFLIGIIYDLLYTNIFINGILFLIVGLISKIIYDNLDISYLKLVLYFISIIIVYEVSLYLLLIFIGKIDFSMYSLIYKILNSLVINILYGYLSYIIFNKFILKKKKLRIN